MPILDVYSKDGTVTTLRLENSVTPPTMTVTLNDSGHTEPVGKDSAKGSNSLGTGVTAAIAVVSVLVVICVATAAKLHLWWCMNLRCKVCLIVRCGRRKPRKGA